MKDFESKIKESKEVIERSEFDNSHEIYKKAMNKKPKTRFNFNLRYAIGFAVMLLVLGGVFTGGYFISKSVNKNVEYVEKEKIIEKEKYIYKNNENSSSISANYGQVISENKSVNYSNFNSTDEIVSYLVSNKATISNAANGLSNKGYDFFTATDEITIVPTSTSSAPQIASSTYKTNTQVEEVDEADIVKVHGKNIFYIPKAYYSELYEQNKLYFFAEENDELEVKKIVEYGSQNEDIKTEGDYKLVRYITTTPEDLYVTDKYLVVRIKKEEYKTTTKVDFDANKGNYGRYDYGNICLFQIYDINSLELVKTIETSGTNVSTRLIDNELYVVNNYVDYLNNNNKFYYYPYIFLDRDIYYPSINNIYYSDDSIATTYVSIYKITLGDEITIEDIHVLTPTVNNIYSSEKNIYLIRTYNSEVIKGETEEITYNKSRVTVINIEDGLSLCGSFDVKGRIGDKYWIDEKDRYIRVVTTGSEEIRHYIDQKYYYDSSSSIFNHLTIFKKTDEGFIETGSITEGLGKPGETIRSARFNGDIVTIVTYKNTDPLYYVDISDPENPVITSALEITGYSIYQHPYKENYVIGFGYENNNSANGYKITLFDVSDKENIKQVGNSYVIESNEKEYVENTGYWLTCVYTPNFFSNPKELFVDNDLGLFGFRLRSSKYFYEAYDNERYYRNDTSKQKYIYEYLVITIDENSINPIVVKTLASIESASYPDGIYHSIVKENYYQRLVFVGKNYYLLSPDRVNCYKIEDGSFVETKELVLKTE